MTATYKKKVIELPGFWCGPGGSVRVIRELGRHFKGLAQNTRTRVSRHEKGPGDPDGGRKRLGEVAQNESRDESDQRQRYDEVLEEKKHKANRGGVGNSREDCSVLSPPK